MDDVEAAAAAETEEDDENEDEEDEDAEADESFDAVSSAGERGIPERILIEGTCGEQDPDFFCCFVVLSFFLFLVFCWVRFSPVVSGAASPKMKRGAPRLFFARAFSLLSSRARFISPVK